MNEELLKRQKELVELLNKACLAYYSGKVSIMSDKEYDRLYDELERTEAQTGIVLDESPTKRVGFAAVSELPKAKHEVASLSLDKTKDLSVLKSWFLTYASKSPSKEAVLSWKCDGLTLVVTYLDGKLHQAVTRGDGIIGEDVTHNAPFIKGLPMTIPFTDKLIVRGEVITSIADFNEINSMFDDPDDYYKTPRNITSGSLRNYDPKAAAVRHMQFRAFDYVKGENIAKLSDAFAKLTSMGFAVVEHKVVTYDTLDAAFHYFESAVENLDIPTDGLVITTNDIEYGRLLGTTKKYPKCALAFKWQDEIVDSTLRAIEWSPSKTGLLNPVAVFDPKEIDGTMVSRASVHNISIMKQLKLSIGATIYVYKANMIIPQIDSCDSNEFTIPIPSVCPICKAATVVRTGANGALSLYCTNEYCSAKKTGLMERFVSREGLDIQGMSTAMIEALVSNNIINTCSDILALPDKPETRKQIAKLDGFGEKSYDNLIKAINTAKNTTFKKFICCLGIDGVGHDFADTIRRAYTTKSCDGANLTDCLETLMKEKNEDCISKLVAMHGIGSITAATFVAWYRKNKDEYDRIKSLINITDDKIVVKTIANNNIKDKVFVVTGSLEHYSNRKELAEEIASYGGKVSGSVSSNTDYLINNDINSTSGKNKTAKELGVPIISEEDYINMLPKNQ